MTMILVGLVGCLNVQGLFQIWLVLLFQYLCLDIITDCITDNMQ